jgi:hypothetical protein
MITKIADVWLFRKALTPYHLKITAPQFKTYPSNPLSLRLSLKRLYLICPGGSSLYITTLRNPTPSVQRLEKQARIVPHWDPVVKRKGDIKWNAWTTSSGLDNPIRKCYAV